MFWVRDDQIKIVAGNELKWKFISQKDWSHIYVNLNNSTVCWLVWI